MQIELELDEIKILVAALQFLDPHDFFTKDIKSKIRTQTETQIKAQNDVKIVQTNNTNVS